MNRLTRFGRSILICGAALWLPACSWLGIGGDEGWLRERQGQYLDASIAPRMDIPSELDAFTIDDLYRIPPEPPGQTEYFVVPPAPKPMDTRVRDGVVIQRLEDRAWIVVGASPSRVWPPLLDYWPTAGIELARADANSGVLETTWIDTEDSDERQKYRVWVEPGLHAGNSEIYVRAVTDNGDSAPDEPREWPERSESEGHEVAMLSSLSVYLADRSDLYRASSVSLRAGNMEAQSKSTLMTGRGDTPTRLELRIDFDRAWTQVTQSLNEAGVPITEQDRDARRLTVRFSGQEDEDEAGFLGRLFGGGDDEEQAVEFHLDLALRDGAVMVEAAPVSGETASRLQDLLIRTINDNLI